MDDGMLIEQVSTFPQLYNKTDARYKNQRQKENAWLSISQVLGETPEACEHRWKILRNKYTGLRREIKNIPSGSGASHITWPYFKMMGFLDKYLQTRRTFSNIETKSRPESIDWNSMSQIIVEDDQENETPELDSLLSSETQENEILNIASQTGVGDGLSSLAEKCDIRSCSSKSVVTPKKTNLIRQPVLKRLYENESIPRNTIPTKKLKTSEALTEKISGCFETFNKVLEKNITEQQTPVNDDEHFVRSLSADMSIFSRKDKITLKKKIYQVLSDHLESIENDLM